jgi:hypothetical protein
MAHGRGEKHPRRRDPPALLGGGQGEVPGLEIVDQPTPVLRLGTYVGSCLGLGGICAYSAVAVAMDVNKQVLYCRNSSGAVMARQVLAISEAEELVCFGVYPYGVARDLKQAFAEYDRAFARALGLSIHDPDAVENGGPSSEVALLLASHWWDDDAWDLRVDD